MPQSLDAGTFLQTPGPILDVRSPREYHQGHIPGAMSFPLFSDDERAAVGTCYKHQGRDAAIELGLQIVGPKLYGFVVQAKSLAPKGQVRLHCWRGGMRSSGMAWLLETAGFGVQVLEGGYKAFRRWGRWLLSQPKPILILGGMTGTGKTAVLQALAVQGEQILDLETLAHHRGSSYGGLGLPDQPSIEHFENLIVVQWSRFNLHRPIWIEAESCQVGRCRIPDPLFQQMSQAAVVEIVRSRPERIQTLQGIYGTMAPEALITATQRIRKCLGGQQTQAAIQAIRQGDLTTAIGIVLDYYDKTYRYDLQRRQVPIASLEVTGLSPMTCATQLIQQQLSLRGAIPEVNIGSSRE